MALPDSAFAIDPATGKLAGFSPIAPASPAGAQPAPASSAPAARPGATGAMTIPKVGEGPPVPSWVNADALAAAVAKQDGKDAAFIAELTAPPTEPGAYKMPSPPDGVPAVELARVPALQAAARDVGLTVGEFNTVANVVYQFAASPLALQTDQRIFEKHADAMVAELDRRYGEARADEIAKAAVATIERARAKAPEMADALRRMICTNRPLIEMLARIDERRTKRS